MAHIPVLQKEVIEHLDPKLNENFIDCTIGQAGHSRAILEKTGPNGKLLGIDASPENIKNLTLKIKNSEKRIILVCDNFANLKEIADKNKFRKADGILFDLGMSSWHLEESGRGFTFLKKEPLDMRYNVYNPLTAQKILNYWSAVQIEKIIREYGEEKFSERIARQIVKERRIKPIVDTFRLVEIIKEAIPLKFHCRQHRISGPLRGKRQIHFATRSFQALRIAVNDELNNLKKSLPQAIELLNCEGRIAIISFHSLEDRIVKNFLREESENYLKEKGQEIKILTKKPIIPNQEEIKINPRSRSAKLRAAKKLCKTRQL